MRQVSMNFSFCSEHKMSCWWVFTLGRVLFVCVVVTVFCKALDTWEWSGRSLPHLSALPLQMVTVSRLPVCPLTLPALKPDQGLCLGGLCISLPGCWHLGQACKGGAVTDCRSKPALPGNGNLEDGTLVDGSLLASERKLTTWACLAFLWPLALKKVLEELQFHLAVSTFWDGKTWTLCPWAVCLCNVFIN